MHPEFLQEVFQDLRSKISSIKCLSDSILGDKPFENVREILD